MAFRPEASALQEKGPYDLHDPHDPQDGQDVHGCGDARGLAPVFQLEAEAALILKEPSALPRELVLALIARERAGAPTCAGVAREEEPWRDPLWMIGNALSRWPPFAGVEPQKAATIWESLVRYARGCPWGEEWELFEEHFDANPGAACYGSPRDAFVSCWDRGHQRVALVGPQIVDDAGWLAIHYPLACRDFEKPRNRSFLRFVSLCFYLQWLQTL